MIEVILTFLLIVSGFFFIDIWSVFGMGISLSGFILFSKTIWDYLNNTSDYHNDSISP